MTLGARERAARSPVRVGTVSPEESRSDPRSAPAGRRDGGSGLLTAADLSAALGVDRSTVYRLTEAGRLPGIKVGRQWRYPESALQAGPGARSPADEGAGGTALPALDLRVVGPVLTVAAPLLGVMMLATDMHGTPLTPIVNPCPWFAERATDPDVLAACSAKWQALAEDPYLPPRFRPGDLGVECARVFVRDGHRLVGAVLAGGLAPVGEQTRGLYRADGVERERVLSALPRIAAALTRTAAGSRPGPGR